MKFMWKYPKDFPILDQKIHGHKLTYLDSAATTQKPKVVLEALQNYYETLNANIHRGVYQLSEKATEAYENTRKHVAKFIGARDPSEIIFTRNATEAINLVAYTWGEKNISEGDEILLTEMEHHSNLVPWQLLATRKGAHLKFIPLTDEGTLDLKNLDAFFTPKTKLLAVTHMSNSLGTINPVSKLIEKAHQNQTTVLIDGAQAAAHLKINVSELNADFYAFSAHKMLGPTGVGVLYGKKEILEDMPPFLGGGEMILEVYKDYSTWKPLPEKFEAGTPNIAGVVAFSAALTYLENFGMENLRQHEKELTQYALGRLKELEGLRIFGPMDISLRGGVISFTYLDIHPHDLGTVLDHQGIAIRTGHHCNQLVTRRYDVSATARASFYLYNTKEDVDILIEGLQKAKAYFDRGSKKGA